MATLPASLVSFAPEHTVMKDPGDGGADSDSDAGTAFGVTLGYGFTDAWSAELEYVRGSAEATSSGAGGSIATHVDVSSVTAEASYTLIGSDVSWLLLSARYAFGL